MHAKCMKCRESSHVTSPRAAGAAPAEDGMGGGEGPGEGAKQNRNGWTEGRGRRGHRAGGKASRSEWWRESGGGRAGAVAAQ